MALNEDALESLIQGGDRRHGTQVKVAEQTDEFEVYERATPRDIMTDTLQQEAQAAAAQEATPEAPPAAQTPPTEAPPTQEAPPAEPTPQAAAPPAQPAPPTQEAAPVQEAPAQVAQEQAPLPVEPAPVEPTRPAAPTLRFPGTTAKPPDLGLAATPGETPTDATHAAPDTPTPDVPTPTATTTATGGDVHVALVQADFNPGITDEMARLATEKARALGATVVQHVHVAGAFDLPLTVQTLARRDGIDAVVALGCVIQGETGHDLTITDAAATQMARIACDEETPIGFGVIGPRMTKEQAEARTQVGANAMESAIRQVRTLRAIADPAQVDTTQYAAQRH